MVRVTMTRQIQCNDAQTIEQRRKSAEGGRIVEPAMQGDDRLTVFRAIKVGRNFDMRQAQTDLFERDGHATPLFGFNSLQRMNSCRSSVAVSRGCSSGNIC